MRHAWVPADLLLKGRFCSLNAMRKHAHVVLVDSQADSLCAFIFHRDTLFQSLIVFLDSANHRDRNIEKRLQETEIRAKHSLLDILPLPNGDPAGILSDICPSLLTVEPFTCLAQKIRPNSPVQVLSYRTDDHISVFVFLFNPKRFLTRPDAWKEMYALMASSSMAVYCHSMLWPLARADANIARHEFTLNNALRNEQDLEKVTTAHSVARFASGLLKVAIALTQSTEGFLFFTSRRGILKCIARESIERRIPPLCRWVATETLRHARQVVIQPDAVPAGVQLQRPFSALMGLPIGHQVAVSDRKRSMRTINSILAVIVLVKHTDTPIPYYPPKALALAQHLTTRLSHTKTQLLAAFAGSSIADSLVRATSPTIWKRFSHMEATTPLRLPFFPELNSALPRIDALLTQAYYVTNSLSATFRLTSPDGKILIRVCAYPQVRLNDRHRELSTADKGSINALVCRQGHEVYIPDTKVLKGDSFKTVRKETQSEWCCPIFLMGRLVGTINMESGIEHAYSDSRSYLRSIAAQISLDLLQARRSAEEIILTISANTSLTIHELLHVKDQLREVSDSKEIGLKVKRKLLVLSSTIGTCLTRGIQTEHRLPKTFSLFKKNELRVDCLARAIAEDLMIHPWVDVVTPIPPVKLSKEIFEPFAITLSEVLRNANTATPIGDRISVRPYKTARAARDYIRLTVAHPVHLSKRQYLRKVSPLLHRVAIFGRDRVHIGALIAGAIVRDAGGEVFSEFHDNKIFTEIEIPEAV